MTMNFVDREQRPVVPHSSHPGFHGIKFPNDPAMPPARPESVRIFEAQRFGLFLHWGPVSLTGYELGWSRGEKVPVAEYDALYRRFNPVNFDADEWVRIAQSAGMRYVVLIAKHMDGFCLWATKQTDYNIMHSPFARDIVLEMADACRRGGLGFGVYYCIADWHHPWFPYSARYQGLTDTPIKPTTALERYTHYVMAQLTELVTGYGPVQCVWFDAMAGAHWPELGQRLVSFLRALQPDILVNDRAAVPGDYVTPEERVGRYRDDRPWESCIMLGTQWSWKPDDKLKSSRQLLRSLIYCAGGDGNLLLNVGPMADGRIEPRQVDRLQEFGAWFVLHGEAIHGTRGGPYKPTSYLASTRRDRSVYLHVFRWEADRLVLPPLSRRVLGATVLSGGRVQVEQTDGALAVAVPPADRQKSVTVIRLDLDGPASDLAPIALPPELTITASATREPVALYAPERAVDSDPATEWSAPEGQSAASLELTFSRLRTINAVKLEDNSRPNRLQAYSIEWWDGARWVHLLTRENIGPWLTASVFEPITTRKLRINILRMEPTAMLSEIRIEEMED